MLGVIKIKGLKNVQLEANVAKKMYRSKLWQAIRIINDHLQGDRNIHKCQEELLEADLEDFAQL